MSVHCLRTGLAGPAAFPPEQGGSASYTPGWCVDAYPAPYREWSVAGHPLCYCIAFRRVQQLGIHHLSKCCDIDVVCVSMHLYCFVCAQVEWMIPDRRIPVPPELDLSEAAEHLISFTSRQPGLVLEFEPDAKDEFDSYNLMFNVRCDKLRKQSDADAAAEEGVALCCIHHTAVRVLHRYIYILSLIHI